MRFGGRIYHLAIPPPAKKISRHSPARPLALSRRTGVILVGLVEPTIDDVGGQPVPVVCGTAKALILSGKVFCLINGQRAIIRCDGGPFLEGLEYG